MMSDHERRSNGSGMEENGSISAHAQQQNNAVAANSANADHNDVNNKKAFASSSTTSGSSPRSTPSPEPTIGNGNVSLRSSDLSGLNLNMSAKEMRARIGSKKKRDPRKDDRMDFKEKFDILDSL